MTWQQKQGESTPRTNGKTIVRQTISAAYMLEVDTFARTNQEIRACRRIRHQEIFKAPWYLAWFKEAEEVVRLSAFNKHDEAKAKLARCLLQMDDMILMFGFVGYWCARDMTKWTAEQERHNRRNALPFGVIPLRSGSSQTSDGTYVQSMYGTYARITDTRTMEETLVYECTERNVDHNYDFYVYNHCAEFVALGDAVGVVSGQTSVLGGGGGFASGTAAASTSDIFPVSDVVTLYRAKSLLEEAIDNKWDANWCLSHPTTYATARPMPDSKLDTLEEDTYYSANTLSGAKQSDTVKKQMVAMQSVRWLIDKMNQLPGGQGAATRRREELLRQQKKTKFKRSDLTEGIHTIPEYVDITTTHAPTVLVDTVASQRQFESDVCHVLRVPYLYFKHEMGGASTHSNNKQGGGGGGGGHERHHSAQGDEVRFHRAILDEEVEQTRSLVNYMLARLYRLTFLQLDVMAALYVEKQARKLGDAESGAKKEKAEKTLATTDEASRQQEKLLARSAKFSQFSALRVNITFEKTKIPDSSSLLPLLQFYERGVIGRNYVKKRVYEIYGEPDDADTDLLVPVTPPQQGPSASAAKKPTKKTKRKASAEDDDDDEDTTEKTKRKKTATTTH